MHITSTAFEEGTQIPPAHTCDGPNNSPHLQWSKVPMDAKSLTLIVEDADAVPGPWTHWLIFNIPPTTTETLEGAIPQGSIEGLSNGDRHPYEGPSPTHFTGTHRCRFNLYALDTELDLPAIADENAVKAAMEGHILEAASLTGLCTGTA